MLKQITCIILINSLLFPQYVFAEKCAPGTEDYCQDDSEFVDSNTTADKKNESSQPGTKPQRDQKAIYKKWGEVEQGAEAQKRFGREREHRKELDGLKHDEIEVRKMKVEREKAEELQRKQDAEATRIAKEKSDKLAADQNDKDAADKKLADDLRDKTDLTPDFGQNPNPFSGKSLSDSGGVKFLGTSLFLNCQKQTLAWKDLVNETKEKGFPSNMWEDSWWGLAESIIAELKPYRLTALEVAALKEGRSIEDSRPVPIKTDTDNNGDDP